MCLVQNRLLVVMLAAALLAGCAGFKHKDQASRLDLALTAYAGAIRWGNFETAAAFTVPRDGSAPQHDTAALAGLKVTGYSVRINRVNETADEADVSIGFTYYQENQGTIHSIEQRAPWYYDDARGSWLLDGALPRFVR
jgi:hypothetical protein